MRHLTDNDFLQVSGGHSVFITRKINAEGISKACIDAIVTNIQPEIMESITQEQAAINVLSHCKFTELELLIDQC